MAGLQKDVENLLNLRNLMKRDPDAYRAEFQQQHRHFVANVEIYRLKQGTDSGTAANMAGNARAKTKDAAYMSSLVDFLAHVVSERAGIGPWCAVLVACWR
jgi:hypothetical protein